MFSKSDFIKEISGIPSRGAASKGEREAARIISDYMRSIGLDVEVQGFKTPTRMPLIHFVHFFMIFLACIVVNWYPIASIIAAVITIASFWGEFTHRFFILRYLIPHSISQNVIGKLGDDSAGLKIVLSAHIDAAKAGAVFHPILSNASGRLKGLPLHRSLLFLMIVLFIIFIAKASGGGTWLLSLVFNTLAVVSVIASIFMIEWECSGFSPGANDDLSGVAVMLSAAERLSKSGTIPDCQFIFVATGAEEAHCSGMKAYLKLHKDEFRKDKTFFINLECLGGGRLKYVTEEGFIIFQKHDHTLIQIADIIARKYKLDFEPTYTVAHSESIVPLTLGFKSIGIIALNKNGVPENYHRLTDTWDRIDYMLLDSAEEIVFRMIETIVLFRDMQFV